MYVFVVVFLGLRPWHMEVSGLGVKSELQLQACTTATAMPDLSHVFDLHHSSGQPQILNPLSKARVRTCILMDTNQIHFCRAMMGTPPYMWFTIFSSLASVSLYLKWRVSGWPMVFNYALPLSDW